MNLAEKIAALRGEHKLSQGDLAEKLEVSRQSVSKWETGQAVPELDKIIRLADLFGVTVDELVRDGEASNPERQKAEAAEPNTRIIYVERPRRVELTPVQILGVIGIVTGAALFFLGAIRNDELILSGLTLVILSLPLLLAKKHPWHIIGLLLFLGSYAVLNPYTTGGIVHWGLVGGIRSLLQFLSMSNFTIRGYRVYLFGIAVTIIRGIVTLALAGYAGWAYWKRWKNRMREEEDSQ